MIKPTKTAALALPDHLSDLDLEARYAEYAPDDDHTGGAFLEVTWAPGEWDIQLDTVEEVDDIAEAIRVLLSLDRKDWE